MIRLEDENTTFLASGLYQ